jgi:threonine aldolase
MQRQRPESTAATPRVFASDNVAGASPEVMQALVNAMDGPAFPYGADPYTRAVERQFSELFERDVAVFLVPTGTAANALGLASVTPPWGGVLCHTDSHINNDECGAPSFYSGGSKLVTVGGAQGKIDLAQAMQAVRTKPGDVHSTPVRAISITQASELGAIYSPQEISAIGRLCREHALRLHMDGARFSNALVSLGCSAAEITWKAGVDVLSFGATKNGVPCAEAIILFDPDPAEELAYRRKRAGHLVSKMRFLSAQMEAYLAGGLWLRNARHANRMAARLASGLVKVGVDVIGPAEANIVFCRMTGDAISRLQAAGVVFHANRWGEGVARFVTSFNTRDEDVDDVITLAS